jgi:hypothetical protein
MIRYSIPAALAIGTLALFGLTQNVAAADNVIVQSGCCSTGPGVCCDDGCHKGCRPTVEKKDVSTRCYGSRCEDFCLPKCSHLCHLFGSSGCTDCCEDGACHDCEHPRTRKYLVLYIHHHEECVPKCVVVESPPVCSPCPPTCTPAPARDVPHLGTPPVPARIQPPPGAQVWYEKLPAAPMPK